MSRTLTLIPTQIEVVAPGDGNRVLLLSWDGEPNEQVIVVLAEETSKTIGAALQAPSVHVPTTLPPGITL